MKFKVGENSPPIIKMFLSDKKDFSTNIFVPIIVISYPPPSLNDKFSDSVVFGWEPIFFTAKLINILSFKNSFFIKSRPREALG